MTGIRTETQKLRKSRGRTTSSQAWLKRQINDPYVHAARSEGYRARSVFKLKEIDERFDLLRGGTRVLDLGAAPGSWSQYAARKGCRTVAVDLLPMEAITNVTLLEGDFLDPAVQEHLMQALGGPADLLLSDMAAPATGQKTVDRLRAEALGEAVLEFARVAVRPGGHCLIKLVRGGEAALMPRALTLFRTAKLLRPRATRSDSSETYLLCRERREADTDAACSGLQGSKTEA